jgi:hypothetical protein
MKTLTEIFAAYIVTAVIVDGGALYKFRVWFQAKTPWLVKGNPSRHLLTCRMCTGFWVSLVISGLYGDWLMLPLVYGASYFLACQER